MTSPLPLDDVTTMSHSLANAPPPPPPLTPTSRRNAMLLETSTGGQDSSSPRCTTTASTATTAPLVDESHRQRKRLCTPSRLLYDHTASIMRHPTATPMTSGGLNDDDLPSTMPSLMAAETEHSRTAMYNQDAASAPRTPIFFHRPPADKAVEESTVNAPTIDDDMASLFSGDLSDASSILSSVPSDALLSSDDEEEMDGSDLDEAEHEATLRRRRAKRRPETGRRSHSKKQPQQKLIIILQKPPLKDEEQQQQQGDRPMLPRKEFLRAGMYSRDCRLTSIEARRLRAEEYADSGATTTRNGNHRDSQSMRKPVLPLPTHYGDWYIQQETDFLLPFDIHFRYTHSLLHVEMDPPPFTRLRANLYVDRKRMVAPAPICLCTRPNDGSAGCREDCINRCTFYECDVNNCPCGTQCSNRAFQTKSAVEGIEVFYALEKRTFGLRTTVSISRGQFVSEYLGEVISTESAEERMQTVYKDNKCFYFLDYSNGEVLDGTVKGSDARFVNHSCNPNCHIEKWHVGGEVAIGLFATKDIAAGTELTYDYNFESFDKRQICLCGSDNCRGYIGKSNEFRSPQKPANDGNKKLSANGSNRATNANTTKVDLDRCGKQRKKANGTRRTSMIHVRNTASKLRSLKERRERSDIKPVLLSNGAWVTDSNLFMLRNFATMQRENEKRKSRRHGDSEAGDVDRPSRRKTLAEVVDYLRPQRLRR